MRQRAEWMVRSDDDILELIREWGNLSPRAIHRLGGPVPPHTTARAMKLTRYGLLYKIDRGLYGITDAGLAYLDEALDARELEQRDIVTVVEEYGIDLDDEDDEDSDEE